MSSPPRDPAAAGRPLPPDRTWVVGMATLGQVFDGYGLGVCGTVVSTFLRDPDEIGQVTPAPRYPCSASRSRRWISSCSATSTTAARGHVFQTRVAKQVIRHHPPCSILLARPPQAT